MHQNPVKRGLVAEPEQWRWSSYRSYAFGEEGAVKLNQQKEIRIKLPPQAL
jgi:putative transposase